MKTTLALQSTHRFANRLKLLREQRRNGKISDSTNRRQSLAKSQRDNILSKAGGRCHICGGKIKKNENWQADHVLAYAHGGEHSIENYLAAHAICNNYRWHYGSEEFQWIMKLGVWLRTLIEKRDNLAMSLAERFIKYERHRITRHKSNSLKSVAEPTVE
jgi:5-methylcytosine-specific restriction endonuclease McrA